VVEQAGVCGRSFAGIAGWNPPGGMDVCFVCYHLEVSARSWSLFQRSHTDCCDVVCDLETTMVRQSCEVSLCVI
jgi:hypothetical protein